MPDLFTNIQGRIARAVSGAVREADGQPKAPRTDGYGDLITLGVLTPDQAAAVEDSLYTFADQGTRDTGVTLTSVTGTTYAATQGLLLVDNNNPVGGPDVIMREVRIKCDTVAGGGTFWQVYHAIDKGPRYASAGNLMAGFNAAGQNAPGVNVYNRTFVAAAATGVVRDVGHNLLMNGVGVAQLEITIRYGDPAAGQSLFTTETTGVNQVLVNAPAVVIHPGMSYVANEFQTARAASAFIGEMFVSAIVR